MRITSLDLVAAAVLAGLFPPFISTGTAANHISITHEAFIESGTSPIDPHVIVQTHDGGYVIAGSSSAVRVDASGVVQWRYTSNASNDGSTTYSAAAILADDNSVLCGTSYWKDESSYKVAGLISHMAKDGRLISEKVIQPSDGRKYLIAGFSGCTTIGNDVVLSGFAEVPGPHSPGVDTRFLWIVVMDKDGNIKNERVLPNLYGELIRVMPNNDFVLMDRQKSQGSNVFDGRRVVRMDAHGTIKAQRFIPLGLRTVTSAPNDSSIQFVWDGDGSGIAHLLTLDDQLNETSSVEGTEHLLVTKRAYSLSDGSLVLFGGQQYEGNTYTASIAWLNRDLNQKQSLVIEPTLASTNIADAVPTGNPGEFATIRLVGPTHHLLGRDEKRLGVALTFIQVQ